MDTGEEPQDEPAKSIFLDALDIDSTQDRLDYVDRRCGGDAALRAEVETLLRHHEGFGDFLERPALGPAAIRDFVVTLATEGPSAVVGPYKLLQEIGEGGMGTVYMAEQERPVRRRVALKLIRPGMDSRQVIGRFEAERQALALMDHPNIARVLDAGSTASGRPYFVMELVQGVPITRFCDERRLTPRERLELFIPVCRAVQHAHQKGVIHRDLKPSNVLVALYDGRPVPKVIDFGVAKATGQKLTEATVFTGFGAIVGTLEYMSPEQAEINQLDIDTRSDVYSLGVLMYELLTGAPPFSKDELADSGMFEMLRMIREKEPSKPSTKLSTAERLPSLAADRGVEPAKLMKIVRGDLDWIAMKALEKDRARRYQTANGFAQDVQRFLEDAPIQARPPSTIYRFRKFARRNRRALMAGAVSVVALLVALVAVAGSVGWALIDRAARRAAVEQEAARGFEEAERWMRQETWTEAIDVVKRTEGVLAGGGSRELRDRLDRLRTDAQMMLRLDDVALVATEMQSNWHEWDGVHDGYARAFADFGIDILDLPVEEAVARVRSHSRLSESLARALDVWACTDSPKTGAKRLHIRAVAERVDASPWRRQVRAALQVNDGATLARLAGPEALSQQARDNLAFLQLALKSTQRPDEALEVLRLMQRQHPDDFWANYWLAHDLYWSKRPDGEAIISYARAAVALRPNCAAGHLLLALALQKAMKLEEAMVYHDRAIALAPENPYAHHDRGLCLHLQGRFDEAVVAMDKAIELWPGDTYAYAFLGMTLMAQRKPDEAIAALRKIVELRPDAPDAYLRLGNALRDLGRLPEAKANYEQAHRLDPENVRDPFEMANAAGFEWKPDEAVERLKHVLERDPNHAYAYYDLGKILNGQGKYKEAVANLKRSIALDRWNPLAWHYLGDSLSALNKKDEAVEAYLEAGEVDPSTAWHWSSIGSTQLERGKTDEAIAAFHRAIALEPKNTLAHYSLGRALLIQGKLDEAVSWCRKSIEIDPNDFWANHYLGVTLKSQKKLDEAADAFLKLSEIAPGNTYPLFNVGFIRHDQNRFDESNVIFHKILELDPSNAVAHYFLAWNHYLQGKEDESVDLFRTTMQAAKDVRPEDRLDLARVMNDAAWQIATHPDARKRIPSLAVDLAQESVRLNRNMSYLLTLGVAQYRHGDYPAAIKTLEDSVTNFASDELNDARNPFFLAMAYWKLGGKDEARKWFKKATKWMDANQPGDPELIRFRDEASELLGVAAKAGVEIDRPKQESKK